MNVFINFMECDKIHSISVIEGIYYGQFDFQFERHHTGIFNDGFRHGLS